MGSFPALIALGGLSIQFGVLVFLLGIFQIHIFIGYILGLTGALFLSAVFSNIADIDLNLSYIICYSITMFLMLRITNKNQKEHNIKSKRKIFSQSRILTSLLLSVLTFYLFQYCLLPEPLN